VDELLAVEKITEPMQNVGETTPQARSHTIRSRVRNLGLLVFQLLDIVTGRAFLVVRNMAY
jgi:hypothetical protein